MIDRSENAYLVFGPESSGTRLVTRILIKAGCIGSDQHDQIWDNTPFPSPPQYPIVFRRSVPHAGVWPNISYIVQQMRQKGYNVQAVVTARDWHSSSKSQLHQCYVKKRDEGFSHLQKAYPHIFKALEQLQVPYIMVTYESIITNHHSINEILKFLQLPILEEKDLMALNLYDGNAKWYNL